MRNIPTVMSIQSTEKSIRSLAKSIRECNRCPVKSGEEIVKIKRIRGEDGTERELITVKKLSTLPPEPGSPNKNSTFRVPKSGEGSLRSIQAGLRKGWGYGLGVVTDGAQLRYVR